MTAPVTTYDQQFFADMRGGVFGCNRQGISESWCAADKATMTREQRAEFARQVMAAALGL